MVNQYVCLGSNHAIDCWFLNNLEQMLSSTRWSFARMNDIYSLEIVGSHRLWGQGPKIVEIMFVMEIPRIFILQARPHISGNNFLVNGF